MNSPAQSLSVQGAQQGAQVDSNPRRFRLIGLLIVAITFGGFGLWSLLAPLQSAALAPGTVTPKGSRKSIEHLEGGIVAEIPVRNGDQVGAGQLLLVLDKTQASARLEIAMGQYFAVKATEARLLAERDGKQTVDYPAMITNSQDPRAAEAVMSQDQVFRARREANEGETQVLKQRVSQLQAQIRGMTALKSGKETLVASYQEEVNDFRDLLSEGFADKQRLRELERNLARTQGEAAEHAATVARLNIQVGETELQILQLNKEFRNAVVDELGQTQSQVYDLDERIRAAADTAQRTEIRSPVEGIVVGNTITTVGEVVRPGEPLMYIVPQSEDLIVQAQVSTVDIDRVHTGQFADIRFSAFSMTTTPVVQGLVTHVSADAHTDQATGISYYLADVEVTTEGMTRLEGLTLVPGMPAEVLISTGDRTLFRYLTQPISNAFARSLLED